MSGGGFAMTDIAEAANRKHAVSTHGVGTPLFLQISDTHIGFNKDANPDVEGTLAKTIGFVSAMKQRPSFAIHTGDITHLSKAAEFDRTAALLTPLGDLHAVPGEHDVTDGTGTEFFNRYGKLSAAALTDSTLA